MSILFAPTVHENQIAHAQVLIEEHGEKFKELYPECPITPKMHYMIHLPRTILRYIVNTLYSYFSLSRLHEEISTGQLT